MSDRDHIGGRLVGGLIAVFSTAALVIGIFAWDLANSSANLTSNAVADLRDFQELALEHPNQALDECDSSQPNMFSDLATSLSDDDDEFGDDRFEYRKDGLTYLSANLLNSDGATKASTPVWIYSSGGYAALDRTAARFSNWLPDAADEYQANPHGIAATRVKTCVLAASRAAGIG